MKKGLLIAVSVFGLAFWSCQNEPIETTDPALLTQDETVENLKIDAAVDDVSSLAEDQFDVQMTSKVAVVSRIPSCATITIVKTNTTWQRTIDFGANGCTYNGVIVKGKMIVSGSLDFNLREHVISYTFDGFFYNGIKIEGAKSFTRTFASSVNAPNLHPIFIMDVNLKLTFPNGKIYERTGKRYREFIVGFETKENFKDDVFLISGNWTTVTPRGTHTNNIKTPLRIEAACFYKIVSGVVEITKENHKAVIDYGAGTCDNDATITIDNESPKPIKIRD